MNTSNIEVNDHITKYLEDRDNMSDEELKNLLMWTYIDKESSLFKSVFKFCSNKLTDFMGLSKELSNSLMSNLEYKNISLDQLKSLRLVTLSDKNLYDIIYNALINNKHDIIDYFINVYKPRKEWVVLIIELITFYSYMFPDFKQCDIKTLSILIDYIKYLPITYVDKFCSKGDFDFHSVVVFIFIVNSIDNDSHFTEKRVIELCSNSKLSDSLVKIFSNRYPKLKSICFDSLGSRGIRGTCDYGSIHDYLFTRSHPFK